LLDELVELEDEDWLEVVIGDDEDWLDD